MLDTFSLIYFIFEIISTYLQLCSVFIVSLALLGASEVACESLSRTHFIFLINKIIIKSVKD